MRIENPEKKVRLPSYVVETIKETAREIFGNGIKLWLFGSRVNPDAKGGDIDLYLETEEGFNASKVIKFLAKLEMKIGERKVDLIVRKFDATDEIAIEAKTKGVRLI